MIRVTIEILPGGDPARAETIGAVDIARIGKSREGGDYAVALKRTKPLPSPMAQAWLKRKATYVEGVLRSVETGEDDGLVTAEIRGHRGSVYRLIHAALSACGVDAWTYEA